MRKISNSKQRVLDAYRKGYHADENGNIWSPYGRQRSIIVGGGGYYTFSVNSATFGVSSSVYVHHLVAVQKYGEQSYLDAKCVRHLNNDFTDNRPGNIAIGTLRDNMLDIPEETRKDRARRSHASLTQEERSERARKGQASRTPEERSETAKKRIASIPQEKRQEITRKIIESRGDAIPWDDVDRDHADGMTRQQLKNKYGMSNNSLRMRYGSTRTWIDWNPINMDRLCGMSIPDLAQKYNIRRSTINQRYNSRGKDPLKQGEN